MTNPTEQNHLTCDLVKFFKFSTFFSTGVDKLLKFLKYYEKLHHNIYKKNFIFRKGLSPEQVFE